MSREARHVNATEAAGPNPIASSTPTERLTRLWWWWFGAYFVTGIFAQGQGETSLLAGTVDRVDSIGIALLFLNLPLQIFLAMTALICDRSRFGPVRKLATPIAIAVTLLILVHIVISIVTMARG